MRKSKQCILALSALMILGGANAFAQRTIDLEPVVDLPTSGTTITNGDSVQVQVTLMNNGSDDLVAGDTIIFVIANSASYTVLQQGILSGQSAVFLNGKMPLSLPNMGDEPVQASFCVTILDPNTSGVSIDSIPVTVSYNDNDTSNNQACVDLTVNPAEDSVPNAIAEVSGNGAPLSLYPNPAQSEVNFKINMEKAGAVTAVVRDITGRTVLNHSFGTIQANSNVPLKLDVSNFTPGMYIIKLHAGEQEYIGKVSVRK